MLRSGRGSVAGNRGGVEGKLMCPQCLSTEVRARPYDNSDTASGYYDCGYEYVCLACGAVSTEDEMQAAQQQQEHVGGEAA